MTPWYPLAGHAVEPAVLLGGSGHGPTYPPWSHIGFLGLGSWAPLTQSIRCCVIGVGSMVALGRQPRPCTIRELVQHATVENP